MFRFLTFFTICVILNGCNLIRSNTGESRQGPKGNGETVTGIVDKLNFENARVRCGFHESGTPSLYEVTCRAMAVQANGTEAVAKEIEPGLTLKWQEPVLVSGMGEKSACSTTDGNLTQRCDIIVQSLQTSQFRVDLQLQEVTQGTRTESDLLGIPNVIPGVIQAENFDKGGDAYEDTTSQNVGGAFRTEGVDIQVTYDAGGGYNVGWIDSGEALKYTVKVEKTGIYKLEARLATAEPVMKDFHVQFNGVDMTGAMYVPYTGAWQTYQTITSREFPLSAGPQMMRFFTYSNGYNINYFNVIFVRAAP